jgi:phosphomethylpyrimidine synthase
MLRGRRPCAKLRCFRGSGSLKSSKLRDLATNERMSANPRDELRDPARLGEAVTRPLPGSAKIHVAGSRPDLRVAMREIRQAPTPGVEGPRRTPRSSSTTPRALHGPGLPRRPAGRPAAMRAAWIEARGDSAALDGAARASRAPAPPNAAAAALTLPGAARPAPRAARQQRHADALCAARHRHAGDGIRGAARERRARGAARGLRGRRTARRHPGEAFGARLPAQVTPEFVRARSPPGAPSSPAT